MGCTQSLQGTEKDDQGDRYSGVQVIHVVVPPWLRAKRTTLMMTTSSTPTESIFWERRLWVVVVGEKKNQVTEKFCNKKLLQATV